MSGQIYGRGDTELILEKKRAQDVFAMKAKLSI